MNVLATSNMSFNTFCNICFIKENTIKLCWEENEPILSILISFSPCQDVVNDVIYLCTNCCNKLDEFNNFRELYLTNFVEFRYLYNEHKKQLEIRNAPEIERKLQAFVQVNVERPSGTPLIENYEAAQVLRNETTCNVDVTSKKESDLINDTKVYLDNYENDCFDEDQENNGITVIGKRSTENEVIKTTSDTVCNVCEESFSCTSDLDVHVCTQIDEKRYNCTKCQKTFDDISKLEIHECVNDGETSYDCDECGLRFINPTILNRHKLKHTDAKPYKCDECGLEFKHHTFLKKHKFKHTDKKPYKCDECGMGFIERCNLITHQLIHTGERPFKCDECGAGFIQRSNLTTHKFIHTGEKPFKCDECGARFTRRFSLNAHKRMHTGENRYKCDKCAFSCNQLRILNRHKCGDTGEKV